MSLDENIELAIISAVTEFVPKGVDKELHVDRREMMIKIITTLYDKRPLSYSFVVELCRNWKEVLYQRAAYAN